MASVGFEPTISVGERPQTYVLVRAATGIGFLQNLSRTFQVPLQFDGNNGYFTLNTVDVLSRWILRMRNVSDRSCREIQDTFYVQYLFSPKIVPFIR